MNKKYILIGLGVLFSTILIITNPSEKKHREAVKEVILTEMKKEMANNLLEDGNKGFAGALQGIGVMIGEKYIENLVDGIVTRKNFILFSLTLGEIKGEQKIAGIGILGNVYISSKLREFFNKTKKEEKEVAIEKSSDTKNPSTSSINEDNQSYNNPEEWLVSIFKCRNGNTFCFYLEKENQICTERFLQFLSDANEIYGPSNLTEAEYPIAEKKYKEKWGSIYPLYTEEMWLFGRGNDDNENIKDVKIDKISDLKYRILIDYGDNIKTDNEVTLVSFGKTYKIDYCKTKFIE